MGRCDICGSEGAYFVCSRCGRTVCHECFDYEKGKCIICSEKRSILNVLNSNPSIFLNKTVMLGVALILAGILLMTAASSLYTDDGESILIIFPFLVKMNGTATLILTVIYVAISILMVFLPWILISRRFRAAAERLARIEYRSITPHRVIRKASMIKDYILTLKMPGFKSEDISIKVFRNTLNVEACRDRKTAFTREYRLPEGYEAESITYNFEGGFLIIRLKIKEAGRGDLKRQV